MVKKKEITYKTNKRSEGERARETRQVEVETVSICMLMLR